MAISGVGATPEPQKGISQNLDEQEKKANSIFDNKDTLNVVNANGDNTITTSEIIKFFVSKFHTFASTYESKFKDAITKIVNNLFAEDINANGDKAEILKNLETADSQIHEKLNEKSFYDRQEDYESYSAKINADYDNQNRRIK